MRPSRVRRLRIRKAISRSIMACVVLAAGLLYLELQKHVTLIVNGRADAVSTFDENVGELLAVHGISVGPQGNVQPSPGTALADGMVVVVNTPKPALPVPATVGPDVPALTTGSSKAGVWVVEGVSGMLREELHAPAELALPAGSPAGRPDAVRTRVFVGGKAHDVYTNAPTVRALLSAMGIEPDGDDRVLPSPSTPISHGRPVHVVKVDHRLRRVTSSIPFTSYTTYSSSVPAGQTRIEQAGRDGEFLRVFRQKVVDGLVVHRRQVDQRVLEEARPEHRVVGAAAQPSAASGSQTGDASWYSDTPGPADLTAASPWLPFGTHVTVANLDNGRSVTVVINDRGPFGGRIIDLSPQAFAAIAPLGQGVAQVRITW